MVEFNNEQRSDNSELEEVEEPEVEELEEIDEYDENRPASHSGRCQDCQKITNDLKKVFMELPNLYEIDGYNWWKWICINGCYYTFPCGCIKKVERDSLCGFIYKHRCIEHDQVLEIIPTTDFICTGNKQRWEGPTPEIKRACYEYDLHWKGENYIVDV